jgi:hypothetical protein
LSGSVLRLAFAQLTWRASLRDIEACLQPQGSKPYHLGFRSTVARKADANAVRDWCIYAQHLIGIARRLYADEPLALERDNTVYALAPHRNAGPETMHVSRVTHRGQHPVASERRPGKSPWFGRARRPRRNKSNRDLGLRDGD